MARGHCGVSGNPEKQKGVLNTHTNIIDEKKKIIMLGICQPSGSLKWNKQNITDLIKIFLQFNIFF